MRPKDLLRSARRLCVQVPNPKLSPLSQALPFLVSCLVVLLLAHVSLVERPGIDVPRPVAQQWQRSPVSQIQSGSVDERDLSGVLLSCFDCNDFILEALGDSQPNFSSDPASCKVYPLV